MVDSILFGYVNFLINDTIYCLCPFWLYQMLMQVILDYKDVSFTATKLSRVIKRIFLEIYY